MSYILDALQKSDSERQSQLAPETYRLSRPPEADGHSAKQLLLLICLLVLIAAGLSVLWWLWSPEGSSLRPAQRISMPAPAAIPQNSPVAIAEPVKPDPLKPEPLKADRSQPLATAIAGNAAAPSRPKDHSRPEQSPQPTAANAVEPVSKRPEAANPSPPVQTRQTELPVQPAEPTVTAPKQPIAPQSKPAQTKTMTTAELPASVRSALPAMAFSFHVYASDPARRTIIINGRRLREGQAINAETRLHRITSDGVIVAFRNYRIALPVINQW